MLNRFFAAVHSLAVLFHGVADEGTAEKKEAEKPVVVALDHFARVEPSIEAKVGYFFFGASQMREIYNQGGVDVQLCAAYPIWKGLQIYGSVEYLQKSGHSLSVGESTSVWQVPVNLGLRPVVTICSWAS